MNWDGIEGQWKQREGKVVHHWVELVNEELAVAGKHEQLVEMLQEKYGVVKKGKPSHSLIGYEIAQSIESLPSNLRSVVLLSDVEKLRYAEIAKTLDCPVGTVCSRLHRGRKVLQQKLSNFTADNGSILRKFEDSEDLQQKSFK